MDAKTEVVNLLSVVGDDEREYDCISVGTVILSQDEALVIKADLRAMFLDFFRKYDDDDSCFEIVSFAEWLNQQLKEKGLTP